MSPEMPAIGRRPPHVPEWAWEGFKRHLEEVSHPDWDPYDGADISISERVAFFAGIVASPNSKSLWTALEAHRGELDRHFDTPDPLGHVGTVLEAAHMVCRRIHPQQRLTTDERRPLAAAVSNSVAKLVHGLRAIRALSREDEPSYPDEFPLIDYEGLIGQLEQIRRGADRWQAEKPVVDRPARGDSERRFFISSMTRYFNEVYATPLERVASLLADCIDFKASGFTWVDSRLENQVKTLTPPKS